MASDVEICSNALRMLGANPIISLTDASTEARLCNGLYESTRDNLLAMYSWNFCTKRASLAQLIDPPAFDYTVQYELPADYLAVITVWPGGRYKIEGRRLLAYSGGAKILYRARIEDPSLFPSWFQTALEYYLAAKIAYPLTRSQAVEKMKAEMFFMKLQEAKILDDHEDTPEESILDVLTSVRLGG